MPRDFFTVIFAVAAVLGTTVTSPFVCAQEAMMQSRLVPAALGIRTDRKGTSWNVEPNGTIGRIGSSMVNSGLVLQIDEETFAGFQPMMTEDGKEFVIPGRPVSSYPGLQVQRRIRLLEEEGILRYAEMLYNGSTDPISFTLSLNTNFSGNYQTFLTNRGRTEPVLLTEGETGVVVLPGAAQSSRAFLFSLAGSESLLKPSLSAQNRYGLGFQYAITLAPGETKILMHQAAQVIIPQNFDRPTLIKLFRPYSFEETAAMIPENWNQYLANFGGSRGDSAPRISATFGIESLGIERGPRDILAMGERTRLLGTASGGDAQLVSSYGEAIIPLDDIAALRGRRGASQGALKLFLNDGQVFQGEVVLPDLKFTQTGGDAVVIDLNTLDRLVFASRGKDGAESSTPPLLLETYHGDRIHLAASDTSLLQGRTPWGPLSIPFSEIIRIQPTSTRLSGHWAEIRDGTRCLVHLEEGDWTLESETFGEFQFTAQELRSLFATIGNVPQLRETEIGIRTHVHLTGSQRLVADMSDSSLPVVSNGLRVDVSASKIRRIERVDQIAISSGGIKETNPSFEVERWDGGILIGLIDLDSLSFKVRGQDWKVPLRDIVRLETPSPELSQDALAQISALIEQLGASEWSQREEATQELGAFGYLAGPVLRRKLRSTEDPEITRRIERILAGLK